jgi:hypothetical protein
MNRLQVINEIEQVEEAHSQGLLDEEGEKLFKSFRSKLCSILKNYEGIDEDTPVQEIINIQSDKNLTPEEIREGIQKTTVDEVDIRNLSKLSGRILRNSGKSDAA